MLNSTEKELAKKRAMELLEKGLSLRENGRPNGRKLFLANDGSFCIQRPDGYVFSMDEEKIDFSKYRWTGGM